MINPQKCANIMAEKDIIQDSLISQKQIAGAYNTFAGECTSQQLRNAMLNILDDEHAIQAELFNCLQSHGWYQTEPADQQKVMQAKQKFTKSI